MEDIFVSATRPARDLAGVFEFDGDTGYLYLFDQKGPEHGKVKKAVRVCGNELGLNESDVVLGWSADSDLLYLKIRNQLCVVLDCVLGREYKGDCESGLPPDLPGNIIKRLPGN